MRTIDNRELAADEFAFRLDTNRAVDVARFLAFLECLRWTSGGGGVPRYDLAIVEFSKGSIFGRLRVRWRDDLTAERMDRMQAELQKLQEENLTHSRRAIEAAERQAVAAEQSNEISRSNRNWTAVGAISGVAVLVMTIGACVKSEHPNPCSTAAADLMEHDDVASFTMWARDCIVVIDKRDVPEVQRREQGIRAGTGDFTLTGQDAELRVTRADGDVDPPWPPNDYFASGSDQPRRHSDGNYGVESFGENPMNASSEVVAGSPGAADDLSGGASNPSPTYIGRRIDGADFADVPPIPQLRLTTSPVTIRKAQGFPWKRSYGQVSGRVAAVGEVYEMRVDQPPNDDETLSIMLPGDATLITGRRYRIAGTLFETHDAAALFVADRWSLITEQNEK